MFSLEYFVVVECRGWINRKSTHNCGLGKVKKNNGIFHLGSLTHPPPYGPLIFWVGMVQKYVVFYINSSHIRTLLKIVNPPPKKKNPINFQTFFETFPWCEGGTSPSFLGSQLSSTSPSVHCSHKLHKNRGLCTQHCIVVSCKYLTQRHSFKWEACLNFS